jgi:hypothetical protein
MSQPDDVASTELMHMGMAIDITDLVDVNITFPRPGAGNHAGRTPDSFGFGNENPSHAWSR